MLSTFSLDLHADAVLCCNDTVACLQDALNCDKDLDNCGSKDLDKVCALPNSVVNLSFVAEFL